jgi:hypothetical protein
MDASETPPGFEESTPLASRPIRDLGLRIEGSALEPVLDEFLAELERAGLRKVRPRFYLSTEWGVPDGTVAVAIPFYLADPRLAALHAGRGGHVEGRGRADVLRYLRHEMGHVVNYAYRLYDDEGWVRLFGSITRPYREHYRPQPFSPRHVRHLPGWYAQKHPDEDWAETFAVWMTPGLDWRAEYADRPEALAKLDYCDRTLRAIADREPLTTDATLDEDVGDLDYPLDALYGRADAPLAGPIPPGLGGALRAIFEDLGEPEVSGPGVERRAASALIRRVEPTLSAAVFRWTGHFPEPTRALLLHLAGEADRLGQVYPIDREADAIAELTCLVATLALNHVRHGSYLPG